jgi:long-chain fatty acid transport protein
MTRRSATTRCLRRSVSAVLLGYCALAQGAGFALLEQSGSRLGTAFAGAGSIADDATTIFFNPAGLANIEHAQAIVVPTGVLISSEFNDVASLPALGQPLGGEGGDAGGWNLVPAVYASAPLNDRLALGIGVNAPFGLKLEYDNGWIGRFQALRSEIKTTNVNPTLTYRFNDVVAIGIGANYQTIQAELTNAVNYTAVIAQGLQQLAAAGQIPAVLVPGLINANAGLEGHAQVRGDDTAWGYNVGLMFDIGAATRIGLAYRSSIKYEVAGSAKFTSPTVAQPSGAAIIAAATAPNGPLATGPASVDLELPDSALLSLRQGIGDRFELLADVAWTGWSSVQELRVVRDTGATLSVTPEKWTDTWRAALGGTYALSDQLKLRAGVAYDEKAVPDSTRTPRLPDVDRSWVAIGAHWQTSDAIGLDFGYAHLFSDDAPLRQNAGNTLASGAVIGEQESSVDIVSVQLTITF